MLELFRIAGRIQLEGGDRAIRELNDIESGGKRAASGIGGFVKGVGKVAAGIGVFELVRKGINAVNQSIDGAISRYDTLNNFPRVMQQMGFDADMSEKAINKLSDGISGLPTTLDGITASAQRIAILTNDLEGATDTTLALNNAFIASGSDANNAARGLDQYVQMLSKGEVDLQSWRTLQETMGVALNDTAKAFGFAGASAQNDLYDALKDGVITFDEFNGKIVELSNETGGFADRARTASGGIATAFTNMRTAIVRGTTGIIESIDNVLQNTPFESLENIITTLGQRFNGVLMGIAELIPIVIAKFQEWYLSNEETFLLIWETIQMVFTNIVTFLQEAWANIQVFWEEHGQAILENVMTIFQSMYDTISTNLNAVWDVFQHIMGLVVPYVQETLGHIQKFWNENGKQIMTAVQNAFKFIQGVIQTVMPIVKSIITTAWNLIKTVFNSALDVIMGLIKIFSGIFTGDWSKLWEGVHQIIVGVFGGILNFFGNLGSSFFDAGKGLIEQMIKGIKNMASKVIDSVKNIAKKVRDFLPFSPAKVGPLSDLDKLDFEGPITDSIRKGERGIQKGMADLLNLAEPTIHTNIGNRGLVSRSTSTPTPVSFGSVESLLVELIQAVKEGKNIIMNDREVGRIVEPYVTESQERKQKVRGAFA